MIFRRRKQNGGKFWKILKRSINLRNLLPFIRRWTFYKSQSNSPYSLQLRIKKILKKRENEFKKSSLKKAENKKKTKQKKKREKKKK